MPLQSAVMKPARALALCLAMLGHVAGAHAQPAPSQPPERGVSLELARHRRATLSEIGYRLEFSLPERQAAPVTGRVTITLVRRGAAGPLVIDFAGDTTMPPGVRANGVPVQAPPINGHLVVPEASLREGPNEVEVTFTAGDGPLNRGDDFLYSLFVPARAHRAFPCFDQPDLKARVTLSLELPAGWAAVANGREIAREMRGDRALVRFAGTKPLSTYLIAFAAGRFQVETAERDGRAFRMFHRETDAAKLARNRDAVFDLHARALAWLERYTGIPYPWDKFDFFLVPAFQFGGMEHPGAIFYNAPAVLVDESATQAQLLGRASLIAHETAHMWFGDLVTMRWFDDVWMKEVFANFFAAKIVNPSFPDLDHDLLFLYAHYPAAYEVDRTNGTHPVRQPLDNLEQAGTLYGAIIYQKAPVAMRQLERMLGEEPFRDGLRAYLAAHAYDNASWPDLIGLLDERTPRDLAAWSRAWVEEAGRPVVRTRLDVDERGTVRSLAFEQEDPQGRGRTWPQAIEVVAGGDQGNRHLPVALDGARAEVPELVGQPAPRFVLPTGGGLGYGDFVLDARSRDDLLAHAPSLDSALTRGAVYVTLWEDVVAGRLPAAAWMDLTLRALAQDTNEQNVTRLLGYASAAFWRRLDPAARDELAPSLERRLREGLDRAQTRTAKALWFQALVRLARTGPTLDWLAAVWRREVTIEGLPLAEPDEIVLAQELAVREVDGWRGMLDAQLARIANPDRKARFEFARPALDSDPAVRSAFFEGLRQPERRRREPWVLEAVGYLHHPLRAAYGATLVAPSLALLEEIQRTGDIFFPKRWLDATLGSHRSPEVAREVTRYLEANPTLAPRLRRLVLQSAYELLAMAGPAQPPAEAPLAPRR